MNVHHFEKLALNHTERRHFIKKGYNNHEDEYLRSAQTKRDHRRGTYSDLLTNMQFFQIWRGRAQREASKLCQPALLSCQQYHWTEKVYGGTQKSCNACRFQLTQ